MTKIKINNSGFSLLGLAFNDYYLFRLVTTVHDSFFSIVFVMI